MLDIARESVQVLSEVLAQWHDREGIAGFRSHTRRDYCFVLLKRFDEPWLHCKAALASLEPTGYARIGPALRHGTVLLQGQQAAKKLLLLISAGKPTDYDRYEGHYGIDDVRTYALASMYRPNCMCRRCLAEGHDTVAPPERERESNVRNYL